MPHKANDDALSPGNDDIQDIEDLGSDQDNAILNAGGAGLDDLGATGGAAGLPEIALPAEMDLDDMERRELMVNPSDLQDVGDPESGDVGVVGGLAAGGEMGMGGRDHNTDDPWGSELNEEVNLDHRTGMG